MDTKVLTYRTIIKKDGKRYMGYVPSLPGCNTDGDTIEETRKNLKEAIELHVSSLVDLGWKVPIDDSVESFESVDITKYKNAKITYA